MTPNELDLCTLVAFDPNHRLLLTERSVGGQRVLPKIAIRKYSRFAEEVTEAIRRNWCTDAIVHFRPQLEGTTENWAVVTIESPEELQMLCLFRFEALLGITTFRSWQISASFVKFAVDPPESTTCRSRFASDFI